MTKPSLRIAFIGVGRMAHLHAGHLQHEPDVTIVAATDADATQAGRFAAQWGGQAFADHRAMLDATPDLDGVYICTPTITHAAIGLDCVERVRGMYVEKPLDLDLYLSQRFADIAAARGSLAMTAFQWRYTDGYRRAAELIGDEPVALVNHRWYWTRPPIRWMWDRTVAGGQVVDQSIHLLDVGRGLAGEVATLYAAYNDRQVNQEPDFQNWDAYALTLRYRRGAVGVSASTYGLFPEITIGPAVDICLRDRLIRVTDKGVELHTPAGVERWENPVPLHRPINQAFMAALRTGDASHIRTPLHEGVRSTALALAANHSAATQAPVDFEAFLTEAIR